MDEHGMNRTSTNLPTGIDSSVESVCETASFSCRRCGHGWTVQYEVRTHVFRGGDVIEIYRLGGVPAPRPTSPQCPHCGGYRVRLVQRTRTGLRQQQPSNMGSSAHRTCQAQPRGKTSDPQINC
jgi:hypothetical protein